MYRMVEEGRMDGTTGQVHGSSFQGNVWATESVELEAKDNSNSSASASGSTGNGL